MARGLQIIKSVYHSTASKVFQYNTNTPINQQGFLYIGGLARKTPEIKNMTSC